MTLLYYVFVWSMISFVYGDVFTVPTAFLARKHHGNKMLWEAPIEIRGGGPEEPVKDEEDEEWEEAYDEEDGEDDGVEMSEELVEDVEKPLQVEVEEEEELDDEEELVEEEDETPAAEDDIPSAVEEAVALEDEVSTLGERSYTDDENSSSFVDRMEARIANVNTDDENSSAFVDRMDLADAYDEVDTTADQEEDSALAAVTAATAIGGADDGAPADEETVAGEDSQEKDTSVVPLELPKEIKDTLKGLKYKAREIDQLRPEVATELAEKGLQRPQEGIPKNWFLEGGASDVSIRQQALKISMLLAALGGLAFVGATVDVGGLIAGVPSILKSLLPTKSTAVVEPASAPITETEVSLVEAEEEEEEDDHPHSVKPNSTGPPAYEKDLDKSWLDKVITKVGDVFKAIWNAKL